jgi:hypothetical protein
MTTTTRRNMMHYHFGFSHAEIDIASRAIRKVKSQRMETRQLTKFREKKQETLQALTRCMKKPFNKSSSGMGRGIKIDSKRYNNTASNTATNARSQKESTLSDKARDSVNIIDLSVITDGVVVAQAE